MVRDRQGGSIVELSGSIRDFSVLDESFQRPTNALAPGAPAGRKSAPTNHGPQRLGAPSEPPLDAVTRRRRAAAIGASRKLTPDLQSAWQKT
jgi:hypothetical protein